MDPQPQPPTSSMGAGGMPPGPKTWVSEIQRLNMLMMSAPSALIVLPPKPDFDVAAAGLGVSESFKKIGRNAPVVSSTPVEIADLPGAASIQTSPPTHRLNIAVDYSTGSFGEWTAKPEASGLTIEVKPPTGSTAIEPSHVTVDQVENRPGIAFLIGVTKREDLAGIEVPDATMFSRIPLVLVGISEPTPPLAQVNLTNNKAVSMSELVTLMLYDLRLPIDAKIAQNLYKGMQTKTQNFTPNLFTANLLEAMSICMRYQTAGK